jgi:hypothetical protein
MPETARWNMQTLGLESRRKDSQIVIYDIFFLFYSTFYWYVGILLYVLYSEWNCQVLVRLVGTQQIKAVQNREVLRIQKSSAQNPFGISTFGPKMCSG